MMLLLFASNGWKTPCAIKKLNHNMSQYGTDVEDTNLCVMAYGRPRETNQDFIQVAARWGKGQQMKITSTATLYNGH